MLCPSQSHAACFLTHPDCISSFLKICFCVYLRFLFFFLNQVLMSDPLQMSPSPSPVDTSVSTDHCSVVLLLLWAPVVCGSPVSFPRRLGPFQGGLVHYPPFPFFSFSFLIEQKGLNPLHLCLANVAACQRAVVGVQCQAVRLVWPDSCV